MLFITTFVTLSKPAKRAKSHILHYVLKLYIIKYFIYLIFYFLLRHKPGTHSRDAIWKFFPMYKNQLIKYDFNLRNNAIPNFIPISCMNIVNIYRGFKILFV